MKIQFFTRNLCLGVLITLVLAFSVQSQQEQSAEIQIPRTVSGLPNDTETLTIIAPENAFIRVGSPDDTFPLENSTNLTQTGTIYRSTLKLPRQTGTYSLSVFIEETRFRVTVSVTTELPQTGALRVRVDPLSGAPGMTATVRVSTTDSNNQPANATVILTAVGGTLSSSSVTTGASGIGTVTLTRGGTAGNENYVVASAPNYDLVSSRFLISEASPEPPPPAGEPHALAAHAGNDQDGTLNTSLAAPFVVKVVDADDNPVKDVRVRFRVTRGNGSFSSRTPRTNKDGLAETTFTPTSTGRLRAVATVPGVDDTGTFYIEVEAVESVEVSVSRSIEANVLVAAANRSSILWVDGGAIYALAHASPQRFASSVENAMNLAVGAGKLYWTEKTGESSGTINSVGLNGTGVTELASIRAVPIGIAVDTVNSKLYWTNSRGRIQSANLDGSGIRNVLENLSGSPMDIALSGGNAYWTQDDGSIRFVNLKGEKVVRDISTGSGTPEGLAIANGKVYWTEMTEGGGGTINSANLDGTDVTELRSILAVPMGIAVDRSRSKVYWTNSRGRIQRANLDGSGIQNVVEGLGSPGEIVMGNSIAPPAPTTPTTPVSYAPYDVNKDGTVDNTDARLVIEALGTSNAQYDVDGNGTVNFLDVVLVFDNRDAGVAGAPTVVGVKLNAVQIDVIEEQINLLIATGDRSPAAMRTLVYLQQLLATARPEKTQLFANYPNPFNPETWIPYELATGTDVRITIYNAQGVVIRTLQLGQQSAGYYTDREHAAYWDGRNALGEQVASGIYFYQLETDTMSAMRKMVILK